MTTETLSLIFQIGTAAIVAYIAFVKSYVQEKGKNLATKEDIQEITEKIENVKSEVGLLTHKKINIATEKYKALMDLNNNYSAWLNYVVYISLTGGNYSQASNYMEIVRQKIDVMYHDFLIAEAKFEVFFIDDGDFVAVKNQLKYKTVELSHHLSKYLIKAGYTDQSIARVLEYEDYDLKMKELDKYTEESKSIFQIYSDEKVTMYKVTADLHFKFIQTISEKIRE